MTAGRTLHTLSQEWGTPQKYVNAVRDFFGGHIDLDPCSNEYSIVNAGTEYGLPGHDGLRESWDFPTIYVNPPYGIDREQGTSIKKWLGRCAMAHHNHQSEVLALVPVATNTSHWKNYVFGQATAVCFLYDTRLKFLVNGQNEGKGAPMSCAMIYWGVAFERFFCVFRKFGAVVDLRNLKGQKLGESAENGQMDLRWPNKNDAGSKSLMRPAKQALRPARPVCPSPAGRRGQAGIATEPRASASGVGGGTIHVHPLAYARGSDTGAPELPTTDR